MKRDRFFFARLALINLKKNSITYIPYLLTCIGSFIVIFTLIAIAYNPGLNSMPGANSLKSMLSFGVVIVAIFSAVFILYTNSFLIKRRQKELALYGILGLEKRHVARTLLYESLYVYMISVVLGLAFGTLLGKGMFLLLLRIARIPTTLEFSPEPMIGWVTAVIFAAIFIMILLTNLLRVRTASPIKLLQGERQGEREPRSSWILTLLGLVTLGGAYAFALTVKSPLAALGLFFLAALMVIVGTFALFTSGSIAVLKLLKRNRRFYYRSENFISVSGMMYRMKQNAAGLASICILSTMVLITLSTTVALYAGQDDILRDRFPLDTTITWDAGSMSQEDMAKRLDATASQYAVTLTDRVTFLQQVVHVRKSGDTFFYAGYTGLGSLKDALDNYSLHLMLLDDYNRMENAHLSLAPDEIVIHTNGKDYGLDSVMIGKDGKTFAVKEELDSYRLHPKSENVVEAVYTLIFRDLDALDTAVLSFGDMPETAPVRGLQENLMFNLSGNDVDILSFVGNLRVEVMESLDYAGIESRQLTSADWFSTYGGFLFIGIFIGGMFLMATVMIIYYKQVSEGNQDRARFEIMQKVGMDRREVRQTIRKQILLVFFLPLAGAVTHVAFAFGILPKMLALFGLHNTPLFLLCTGLTLLVFILIYLAVFALTARTYDRLVRFGFETP